MGFAAPALAWLAAFASIPVLVHILSRLRLRRVQFPSLMLLTSVRRERVSWVRIREIVLLVLRTLALLALLLAVARPFINRRLPGAGAGDIVLLVDDSWSLDFSNRWPGALERAGALVMAVAPGRRVCLLLASGRAGTGGFALPDRALARLDSLAPSTLAPKLGPGLARARALADSAAAALHVVSDFQRRAFDDSLARGPATLHPVGESKHDNCGILELRTDDPFPAPGRPLRLRAVVANHGPHPASRSAVLFFDGARAEQLLTIPARGTRELVFEPGPAEPGIRACSLLLTPDSLALDDRRYLVLDIPAVTRVLAVGSPAIPVRYFADALGANSSAGFELTVADAAELAALRLDRFDIVALLDPYALARADWNRFEFYLRSGGAGLVFCGPGVPGRDRLDGAVRTAGFARPEGFVTVTALDTTAELLAGLGPAALASVRVREYARLDPGLSQVLARLSDGNPFLVEHHELQLVACAVGPVPGHSDLVHRAAFVPLLHRTLSRLGRRPLAAGASVGDTIAFRVKAPAPVRVSTPGGSDLVEPGVEGNLARVAYPRTGTPGIYRFDDGTGAARAVAVNPVAGEGDLERIGEKELAGLGFELAGAAPGRTDLAGPLLLLAATALLLEMLLLLF